jgi:hypothetical protein
MANVLRRLGLRIVGDEMPGVIAGGSLVAVTSRPFLKEAVTGRGEVVEFHGQASSRYSPLTELGEP